ncbi:MAG: hypothetical protein GY854_12635 [Deltaproteobacteria bacterium]|nr:hypothetical protein [Deltaproteobacteria bacterium]
MASSGTEHPTAARVDRAKSLDAVLPAGGNERGGSLLMRLLDVDYLRHPF